mgnify:CR=1 FL=1
MYILVLGLIKGVHTRIGDILGIHTFIGVNFRCAYSYRGYFSYTNFYCGKGYVYILVLWLMLGVHTRIGVNYRCTYSNWGSL